MAPRALTGSFDNVLEDLPRLARWCDQGILYGNLFRQLLRALGGRVRTWISHWTSSPEEQTAIRRVPSVYHGLSGTKRDRLISKGFLH